MCFFLCLSAGPAAGSGPFVRGGVRPLARDGVRHFVRDGVRHFVRGGVRHFARDGVRPLCLRWGQAPLPAAESGTLARDGVRHLCLRWGLTPEGIVTYLHLRFILRCFIIVGAGGSTNIA